MPVVGGLASIWAASKIIPVMWLCSTYFIWRVRHIRGKCQWQRDLIQFWCYVFPGLLKLHSPRTDVEYGPVTQSKKSRQPNRESNKQTFTKQSNHFAQDYLALRASIPSVGPQVSLGADSWRGFPCLVGTCEYTSWHGCIHLTFWGKRQYGCFSWSEPKGRILYIFLYSKKFMDKVGHDRMCIVYI